MSDFACEITDAAGKAHFVGVGSCLARDAKDKGFATRIVRLSGHCIYATANFYIHYPNPGNLRHGPVKINGELPDKSKVATVDESREFFDRLLSKDVENENENED